MTSPYANNCQVLDSAGYHWAGMYSGKGDEHIIICNNCPLPECILEHRESGMGFCRNTASKKKSKVAA